MRVLVGVEQHRRLGEAKARREGVGREPEDARTHQPLEIEASGQPPPPPREEHGERERGNNKRRGERRVTLL